MQCRCKITRNTRFFRNKNTFQINDLSFPFCFYEILSGKALHIRSDTSRTGRVNGQNMQGLVRNLGGFRHRFPVNYGCPARVQRSENESGTYMAPSA